VARSEWADAEEGVRKALGTARPETVHRFDPAVAVARAAGLGKLWCAVGREGFGGAVPGIRAGRAAFRLPDGTVLTGPASVADPFAEHAAGLCVVRDRDGAVFDHPAGLLGALAEAQRGPQAGWPALAAELAESVANHALSLVAEAQRREARGFGRPDDAPGALAWATGRAEADLAFSPLAVFEQAVVDGHPLHPCARIRGGMPTADLFRYAPEWAEVAGVGIVAVAGRGPTSLTGQLRRWHPDAVDAARRHLRRAGRDPDAFDLVPVHPWQLEHTIPVRFEDAIDRGDVVPVPGVSIPARPLVSFRTMAPAGDRRAAHLKTAIDVRLTTAVRTVSPAATRNGPAASALVGEILPAEERFGGRFAVVAELAGGGYRPRAGEPGDAASLSAIIRESPELRTTAGEVVLPSAALAARSPTTGRLLVADALGDIAAAGRPGFAGAAAEFLGAYCACALPALFTLLTRWGVGLEAHGENLLVVLRAGLPVRVVYRDFGGVRICRPRLAARRGPGIVLSGAVPTDDDDELRTKFLFPLVETNLGQLVSALVRAGGGDPGRLWAVVARRSRSVYAELAADPTIRAQALADEDALFSESLPAKAMLRTQLSGTPHAARWITVANPLADTA
jgi:siderophore synthetase component